MRFTWSFLVAIPLVGQALLVSSATGTPGEKITIEISLASPANAAPSAVQWDLVFPDRLIEMESGSPEVGPVAKESGKLVTCTARKPYSYSCILAGGQKPIMDGAIAVLHFRIRSSAKTGSSIVRVERAEAVTAELKKSTLRSAEGTVTVH